MKKKNLILAGAMLLTSTLTLAGCGNAKIVVYTEAGFAPFEYIKDNAIVGVDVDIMNKVGEKLGKEVEFENVNFDTIIDAVSKGDLANVGAAGISVTDARKEKVDFSDVYYEADLYCIYAATAENTIITTMSDGEKGTYWSKLASTKGIGVQGGTTADLFLSDEIAEGGSLSGTKKTTFSSLSVAVEDIGKNIDYVVIDELPAKALIKNKSNLKCAPIYYQGENAGDPDELAADSYAIAVTKGQTELLNAINDVLKTLMVKDSSGQTEIDKMIASHLGI